MEGDGTQRSVIDTFRELMSLKPDTIKLYEKDFLRLKTLNCYYNRVVLCVSGIKKFFWVKMSLTRKTYYILRKESEANGVLNWIPASAYMLWFNSPHLTKELSSPFSVSMTEAQGH